VSLINPTRLKEKLHFLENSLKRSGSCLLSIELVSGLVAQLELAPFIQTIAAHSARWEHLKVSLSCHHSLSVEGPLRSLRSLTAGMWRIAGDPPPLPAAFHTVPNLRRIAISHYDGNLYQPILPWAQLTVLIVDFITAKQFVSILNLATNLVYCRLSIYPTDERYARFIC
jgi:hypothetical protein